MSTKPKPAAPKMPEHVLAEQAIDSIGRAQYGLEEELEKANVAVGEAREALAATEAHQRFVAGKARKLYELTFGSAAVKQILTAKPHDGKLLGLLRKCKNAPWAKFARDGAPDDQIATVLKVGWPHHVCSSAATRSAGGQAYGPRVWIDSTSHKPTLEGKPLIAEARRLLQIPQPKPKAAAPAKRPAAKKPAPADAPGGGGTGTPEADVSLASLGPVDSIEPGETYTLGELGIRSVDLEAHLPPVALGGLRGGHPEDDRGGHIGGPLMLSDGDRWAVVGAAVGRDATTYALQPVYATSAWGKDCATWAFRRALHRTRAPEDVPLTGLIVDEPGHTSCVLGPDEERIYCAVPRPAATPAAGRDSAIVGDPNAWAAALRRGAEDEAPEVDLAVDALMADPNANLAGVYIRGVRTIGVSIAKGNLARVELHVAKGNDGRYRAALSAALDTSHTGAAPNVRGASYATEPEAARAAAGEAIAWIRATGGGETGRRRQHADGARRAVEDFLAHNPAARVLGPPPAATAGPSLKKAAARKPNGAAPAGGAGPDAVAQSAGWQGVATG